MSSAAAARRLATAAAFGGGGLGALGASLFGVLKVEASLARRAIGPTQLPWPDAGGVYGRGLAERPIRIALLGDSAAVGYGLTDPDQTPGAILAAGLAEVTGRPVRLFVGGVVGAESRDLDRQIDTALVTDPEITVIVIGANDVTHTRPPRESVRCLSDAVRRLREADSQVVVGTCPDLGTIRPIAQPLKQVARLWSRRLAAAQTIATVEAGGRSVSLGALLGPDFEASPSEFFGPDQFHPSAYGYASVATAMLPSVVAALEELPDTEELPEIARGESVLEVSRAAAEASREAGTEVAPTQMRGRGRWAALRHRRWLPLPLVDRVRDDTERDDAARSADEGVRAGDQS
ncbi:MAG: SGNH/GDSL hydrolase family protein [Propionibacteriales bacterium]|nr:SGNH/GDSL hydrolase family protein [Propionibacteriales bacterium]